jgi:hypothetical protein
MAPGNHILSPADEAFRGILSRYLGIHFWAVGAYRWSVGIAALIATAVAIVITACIPSLYASYYETCCYPDGAPLGYLGDCTDPASRVNQAFDKVSCYSVAPLQMGLYFISALVAISPIFMAWSKEGIRVYKAAAVTQGDKLLDLCNDCEEHGEYEDVIKEWMKRHLLLRVIPLLPESFFLGGVYETLEMPLARIIHIGMILCIVSMVGVFFDAALPMDACWRCYPANTPLHNLSLGCCDDATSSASTVYADVSKIKHIHFFWHLIGAGCTSILLTFGFYIWYATRHFNKAFATVLIRRVKTHKEMRE